MPYIKKEDRRFLDPCLASMGPRINTPGELNYCITRLVVMYLYNDCGGPPAYSDFNAVVGVLECLKLELYRRMLAPYEDAKKEENGDAYV